MRLIHIVGSEAIRFLPIESAYGGGLHFVSLKRLAENFQMADGPKKLEELDLGNGIEFRNGIYSGKVFDLLRVHNAGFVAQAKLTTDACDEIIDKAIDESSKAGLKIGKEEARSYFSSVVVEWDISFDERFLVLYKAIQVLNNSLRAQFGGVVDGFEGFGIHLWANKTTRPVFFKLEKRVDSTGPNQFFSSAPLRTADHMKVLDAIASIS